MKNHKLSSIGDDLPLVRVANTSGGEWAGPCPVCGGNDRFRVWPYEGKNGRYWCRKCGQYGDAIQYHKWIRKGNSLEERENKGVTPRKRKRIEIDNSWWKDQKTLETEEHQESISLEEEDEPPAMPSEILLWNDFLQHDFCRYSCYYWESGFTWAESDRIAIEKVKETQEYQRWKNEME